MTENTRQWLVTVSGCDDSTEAWVELTDNEAAAVEKVAAQINAASTYNCQPTMQIDGPANNLGGDQ